MLFNHKDKAPAEPPSYEQLQGEAPGYQNQASQYSDLGPDEYPEDKKSDHGLQNGYQEGDGNGSQNGYQDGRFNGSQNSGIPPGTYVVPPQKANIAYDTEGTSTRPGYKEYLEHDNQRVAQGDLPKPRSFFGRKGAPLAPSKKGGSGGAFPGASGSTYYDSSK